MSNLVDFLESLDFQPVTGLVVKRNGRYLRIERPVLAVGHPPQIFHCYGNIRLPAAIRWQRRNGKTNGTLVLLWDERTGYRAWYRRGGIDDQTQGDAYRYGLATVCCNLRLEDARRSAA